MVIGKRQAGKQLYVNIHF